MWAALTHSAMYEQEGMIQLFSAFFDILLQQIAESYLLARALLSKLTWL